MHRDPTKYFKALGELGARLAHIQSCWDDTTSPLESEMLILTGALYLRKLDEHGCLKSGFALAGRTFKAKSGDIDMKTLCDRLIHSQLLETTDFNDINFRSDRGSIIVVDGAELARFFIRYSKDGCK